MGVEYQKESIVPEESGEPAEGPRRSDHRFRASLSAALVAAAALALENPLAAATMPVVDADASAAHGVSSTASSPAASYSFARTSDSSSGSSGAENVPDSSGASAHRSAPLDIAVLDTIGLQIPLYVHAYAMNLVAGKMDIERCIYQGAEYLRIYFHAGLPGFTKDDMGLFPATIVSTSSGIQVVFHGDSGDIPLLIAHGSEFHLDLFPHDKKKHLPVRTKMKITSDVKGQPMTIQELSFEAPPGNAYMKDVQLSLSVRTKDGRTEKLSQTLGPVLVHQMNPLLAQSTAVVRAAP